MTCAMAIKNQQRQAFSDVLTVENERPRLEATDSRTHGEGDFSSGLRLEQLSRWRRICRAAMPAPSSTSPAEPAVTPRTMSLGEHWCRTTARLLVLGRRSKFLDELVEPVCRSDEQAPMIRDQNDGRGAAVVPRLAATPRGTGPPATERDHQRHTPSRIMSSVLGDDDRYQPGRA